MKRWRRRRRKKKKNRKRRGAINQTEIEREMEAIKIQGIGAIRRASSSFPRDPIIRANILERLAFSTIREPQKESQEEIIRNLRPLKKNNLSYKLNLNS